MGDTDVEFGLAVAATVVSGFLLVWLLTQIELNKTSPAPKVSKAATTAEGRGAAADSEEAAAEEEEDQTPVRRRRRRRWTETAITVGTVGILILLTYLLLVASGAPLWAGVLGHVAVVGIFLRNHVVDELRRRRLDRLSGVVALFLFVASFLSYATYATKSGGGVYVGPARIVGYDTSQYDDGSEEVTRANLQVAWGSGWGCPSEPEKECVAELNGALCQAEVDEGGDDGEEGEEEGRRRRLEDGEDEGGDDEEQEEEVEEAENENDEEDFDEEYFDDEIGGDDDNLWEFDDDFFDADDYWNKDWSAIWGEYACEDLFDSDMAGLEYDASVPPGTEEGDDWPFLQIYGNCKNCKAFLDDYYTTDHFNAIESFKTRGTNFAIAGAAFLVMTGALVVKQRMSPEREKEIELLQSEGGIVA